MSRAKYMGIKKESSMGTPMPRMIYPLKFPRPSLRERLILWLLDKLGEPRDE